MHAVFASLFQHDDQDLYKLALKFDRKLHNNPAYLEVT